MVGDYYPAAFRSDRTGVTIYTVSATTSNYDWPFSYSIFLPAPDDSPKRKIPFYRALFDQRWPMRIEPNAISTARRPWQIHAGKREARPASRFSASGNG